MIEFIEKLSKLLNICKSSGNSVHVIHPSASGLYALSTKY